MCNQKKKALHICLCPLTTADRDFTIRPMKFKDSCSYIPHFQLQDLNSRKKKRFMISLDEINHKNILTGGNFIFIVPCIITYYEITNRCNCMQSILFHY